MSSAYGGPVGTSTPRPIAFADGRVAAVTGRDDFNGPFVTSRIVKTKMGYAGAAVPIERQALTILAVRP